MKTQVYALHIAYNGYEDKIWRTVEVSSKYTLAQLGYLILHTFDTLAYHAFEFSFKDTPYVLPMILEESDIENAIDATQAKLQDLNLAIGDTMEMVYDYGCSHVFDIRVTSISDMAKGTGTHYPYVVEGQGRGILDWYSTKRASGAPCVGTPSINLNVMLGVPFSMFTAYQFLIGETGSRVEGTVRD